MAVEPVPVVKPFKRQRAGFLLDTDQLQESLITAQALATGPLSTPGYFMAVKGGDGLWRLYIQQADGTLTMVGADAAAGESIIILDTYAEFQALPTPTKEMVVYVHETKSFYVYNLTTTLWEVVAGDQLVTSVNTKTGDVVLNADDIEYATNVTIKDVLDGVVTIANAQTITGAKTFTAPITISTTGNTAQLTGDGVKFTAAGNVVTNYLNAAIEATGVSQFFLNITAFLGTGTTAGVDTTKAGKIIVTAPDGSVPTLITTYVTNEIAALGDLFVIKGVLDTEAELPATGNSAGDVYFVGTGTDPKEEFVWIEPSGGTAHWESLGTIQEVDLTNYYNKTESDARYVTLATNQTITGVKIFMSNTTFSAAATVTHGDTNNGVDVTSYDIKIKSSTSIESPNGKHLTYNLSGINVTTKTGATPGVGDDYLYRLNVGKVYGSSTTAGSTSANAGLILISKPDGTSPYLMPPDPLTDGMSYMLSYTTVGGLVWSNYAAPSNMVTTNTTQTITGLKTFNNATGSINLTSPTVTGAVSASSHISNGATFNLSAGLVHGSSTIAAAVADAGKVVVAPTPTILNSYAAGTQIILEADGSGNLAWQVLEASIVADKFIRVSPNGLTTGADGSAGKPFKTLAAAVPVAAAMADSIIVIYPGVRGADGTATITQSNIRILGFGQDTCELTLTLQGANNCVIENVALKAPAFVSNGVDKMPITIKNCKFT